jgi:hypothetical protein
MALRCIVVRGLVKEVEEELNKFLGSNQEVRVLHMAQSETGDHLSVTLLVDEPDLLLPERDI